MTELKNCYQFEKISRNTNHFQSLANKECLLDVKTKKKISFRNCLTEDGPRLLSRSRANLLSSAFEDFHCYKTSEPSLEEDYRKASVFASPKTTAVGRSENQQRMKE